MTKNDIKNQQKFINFTLLEKASENENLLCPQNRKTFSIYVSRAINDTKSVINQKFTFLEQCYSKVKRLLCYNCNSDHV